ncbi:thiamine phosphate synthase, partial [Yoonia sp.]|uniref:thiamine phosphate synthase n=1 Tax=Yoonia sp. TaxID=2212373 RepID=UPI002394F18C
MKLDRFYPIFDSADWIARLVPLGIKLVQLRIKDANPDMIRDHVRRAKSVCADHDCMLVINDHWQIAINEGC